MQLDLFGRGTPAFDAEFSRLLRRELRDGAWVDHQVRFVAGHDALFAELEQTLPWHTESRAMYDRIVETPRLLARLQPAGLVEELRRALSARYRIDFVHVTAALYRDGNDSVAWHGDTTARDLPEAIVATISLGEPRRFLLRPTDGGASIAYDLGCGDLIVMGGSCQRTWRHSIPKVAHAGPRIALMFRHAYHSSSS